MAPGLYPWLRAIYADIAASSQWHHAMLLKSAGGLAVEQLVQRLVELKHCQQPTKSSAGPKACGKCQHCLLHQSGSHPDHMVIEPTEGKSQISIEQIRRCANQIHNKGLLSPYRLVQINQAERMTLAAANALLKVLEEPPSDVYFFLSTEQGTQLLPTIISRCSQYSITKPKSSATLAWLNKRVTQTITSNQLAIIDGSPLRAIALDSKNGFAVLEAVYEAYIQVLAGLHSVDLAALCLVFIDQSQQLIKEESELELLNLMQQAHRHVLKASLGAITDTKRQCTNIKGSETTILKLDAALIDLRQQIVQNKGINIPLQVQQLIVNNAQRA